MGDDDGAAVDPATPEQVVGLPGVVEREAGDLGAQETAGSQVENLDQLGTVAPVRRLDARLVGEGENENGRVPPPSPTTVMSASWRATAALVFRVSSEPTMSSTTTAPKPRPASRT